MCKCRTDTGQHLVIGWFFFFLVLKIKATFLHTLHNLKLDCGRSKEQNEKKNIIIIIMLNEDGFLLTSERAYNYIFSDLLLFYHLCGWLHSRKTPTKILPL